MKQDDLLQRLERERPEHPIQLEAMREHYARVNLFWAGARVEARKRAAFEANNYLLLHDAAILERKIA